MSSQHSSTHVHWQPGKLAPGERFRLLGQEPVTLWLTGLSGAGKSTLAFACEHELALLGRAAYVLDGDNVRHGLNRDLGFSPADRSENIRRIAEVAKLMNDAGLIVIAAFISPYRDDRAVAREVIGRDRFLETFVRAPLSVCEERDPKGLYKKARAGEIAQFTGLSAPYEIPEAPEIVADTATVGIKECVSTILQVVLQRITLD